MKSSSRPATTNATSTFAARTCSSSRRAPARRSSPPFRVNTVRRGRTAWITPARCVAAPATATQSPTAGQVARAERLVAEAAGDHGVRRRRARCASDRRVAVHGDDPGRPPAPPRRTAGRRPPSPRPSRGRRAGSGSRWRRMRPSSSADPLELAGPLRVALGAPERPQPERDEHDAHHDQRPDVVRGAPSPASPSIRPRGRRRGRTSPATGARAPASSRAGPRPSSRRRDTSSRHDWRTNVICAPRST